MSSKLQKNFIRFHVWAGMLTVVGVLTSLVAANIGFEGGHVYIHDTLLRITLGSADIEKTVFSWINCIGMTVILAVVTAACKRGVADEELVGPDRLRLPLMAALGALSASGLAGIGLAWDGFDMSGAWIVVAGTDLAVGLAVLSWLGERVPGALKIFFMTMSMFVLLGCAVLPLMWRIADTGWPVLFGVLFCLFVLLVLNRARIESVSLFALVAAGLWGTLLLAGLTPYVAGIAFALAVPVSNRDQSRSLLMELEQDLLPMVCLVFIPLMAMAHYCLPFADVAWSGMADMEMLVLVLVLFPVKGLLVLSSCWLGVNFGACSLPPGIGWREMAGVCLLCGVSLGANLFLGTTQVGPEGVFPGEMYFVFLVSSVFSILAGYGVLRYVLARRRNMPRQR